MSNRCKSPWTTLFVEVDGSVKSCCPGSYYWGNLHEQTIEEILNSDRVVNIKQQIINDEPVDYCSNCRRDEAATGWSLRNHYNTIEMDDTVLESPTGFLLKSTDIRWNSLCNLACVYCNEFNSTLWQKYKSIPIATIERPYHDNVLNFVKDNNSELETIFLLGGEPLIQYQNATLLEYVDSNCNINVVTNLKANLDTNPVFTQLKTKNDVVWSLSFENVGERFEYVRHGGDWAQHVKNINTLKTVPGHKVALDAVYCIYSALNLVELYEFARDIGIQAFLQPLFNPHYLNVANFSVEVRNRAIEEIDSVLALPYIHEFYERNYNYLVSMRETLVNANPETICNNDFLAWAEEFDSKYAKNSKTYKELWPEAYELIKSTA